MNPQKLEKWRRHLGQDPNADAAVFSEVISLLNMRRIFNGIREMIQQNEDLQGRSLFFEVWGKAYADSVLMHIRRLAKSNPQGVSLIGILRDLKGNNQMVTQEWYVQEFSTNSPSSRRREVKSDITKSTFTRRFTAESDTGETSAKPHLDADVISSDIAHLEEIHDQCSDYINWRIAHLDHTTPEQEPTFDELDEWITEIKSIFKKYYLLLFGVDLQVQTVLTHDWKKVFRHPWLQR